MMILFLMLITFLLVIPYIFTPSYLYDEFAILEKGHFGFITTFYKILLTRKVFWVGLLISFFMLFTITKAIGQTAIADPAYWNMQRAMGGIIQQSAQARGYSTTDPRTYSTLYGIGKTATSTLAGVGAGVLVVGTAPGWATLLAVTAISAGVGYLVSLGIDAAVKWAFGTSPTSAAPVSATSITLMPGQYFPSAVTPTGTTQCSPLHPSVMLNMCPGASNGTYMTVCQTQEQTGTNPTYPSCVGGSFATAMAAAGYVKKDVSLITTSSPQSLATQVAASTSAQKSQPVSYQKMALLANELWKKAAAASDYAGIPYSVTQPITATDVETWAVANPSSYPTVGSLVAAVPSTATSTAFFPSTTTDSTTTPATASTSTPTTGTNAGQASAPINLGVDPNIGSPSLETTPTAQMIVNPLLNLFPTFKNFAVPAHSGICPKPTFDVFNKHFLMDSHCTLFENQRTVLYSSMMLVYVLASLFIVLKA
jgi:hypothetical protein